MRWRAIFIVLALGGAALLIALIASAEIVEHDATLSHSQDAFWRVRFVAGLELHVSAMTRPNLEAIVAMILFLLGGAAGVSFLLLRRLGTADQQKLLAFFGVVAAGAIFLAVDELIELNETIAANLTILDRPPFPGRGNLDVMTYPPAVLAFLAAFWPILRSSPRAFALWMTSIGLFALTSTMDVVGGFGTLELVGEVTVSAGIAAGFIVLAVDRFVALGPEAMRGRSKDSLGARRIQTR